VARRVGLIWLVLALVLVITGPKVERLGDRYQIALPLMALGCQIANGGAVEYALRYAIGFTGLHAAKWGLGEVALNARPRGGYQGFPSGHTAAASFGAASLATQCIRRHPLTKAAVIIAAGFTGGSRVAVGAHDLLQVTAGAIWGAGCALAFGRGSRSRRWLVGLFTDK
jgi:membrane-associated phospholipid phosphatase